VKSFTKSWLTSGFMIAYVYLACLFVLFLVRIGVTIVVDLIGRNNLFWLRKAIARERGIKAYRAWLPFERIRPDHIPQQQWEQEFAWPADNQPPYQPLAHRVFRGIAFYGILILLVAVLLQVFTRFSVLTWLAGIGTR
jgi:small-conductance mechanosensitive channel